VRADDDVAKQLAVIVNDINTKIFSDSFVDQVDDINQYNDAITQAADLCESELATFEGLVNTMIAEYKDAQDKKQKALQKRVAIDYVYDKDQAGEMETEYQEWLDATTDLEAAKSSATDASGTPATSTVTLASLASVSPDAAVADTLALLKEIVGMVGDVVDILEATAETSRFTSCATALKAQISLADSHIAQHPISDAIVAETKATFEAMDEDGNPANA